MTPHEILKAINKFCDENKLSYQGCARHSISRPVVIIVYTPAHHAEIIEDFAYDNRFHKKAHITFREFPSWVHEGYEKGFVKNVVHV